MAPLPPRPPVEPSKQSKKRPSNATPAQDEPGPSEPKRARILSTGIRENASVKPEPSEDGEDDHSDREVFLQVRHLTMDIN